MVLQLEKIPPLSSSPDAGWRAQLEGRWDAAVLGLALCAVPISIAIAESLLAIVLILRSYAAVRERTRVELPRVFWFWLAWAVLEVASWLSSPEIKAGQGEIRHLLLLAALFFLLPALNRPAQAVLVWRGIFFTATVGSAFLIGGFVMRWMRYRREFAASADPSFYLRTGGLLHHWMVYGTVEILVFAALLECWRLFPEQRRFLLPVAAINGLAIFLSLTRTLWICCLVLLALHLAWRRSRWIWSVPALPVALFLISPGPVRFRVTDALRPTYYSNAERLQMLRVGARMTIEHPLAGVGPGRVESLYRSYLPAGDPVPAYHGHLHNNVIQLAAQFGLPVVLAAGLCVGFLFHDLWAKYRSAYGRESEFLCRTSLLGLVGFLLAGMFDYTYGHSLGLILLSFVVLAPLAGEGRRNRFAARSLLLNERVARKPR